MARFGVLTPILQNSGSQSVVSDQQPYITKVHSRPTEWGTLGMAQESFFVVVEV